MSYNSVQVILDHLLLNSIVKFAAIYCRTRFFRGPSWSGRFGWGYPNFPSQLNCMFVQGIDKVMRHKVDLTLSVKDPGVG